MYRDKHRFFVKKLIKQQIIPTVVINRANKQAFGLWKETGSLAAGTRCSTLWGGGLGSSNTLHLDLMGLWLSSLSALLACTWLSF